MVKKKNTTQKFPLFSIGIFALFIISVLGIWFYAAHCFEKNINHIHDVLVKTGHVTTGAVHIEKYKLKASIEKPVIKVSDDESNYIYTGGDRMNLSYQILTKTLSIEIDGDEFVTLNAESESINLVSALKKDNTNKGVFSVRFDHFFPKIEKGDGDYATQLKHIIDVIKSVRLLYKNAEISVKGIGTLQAKLIKFTSEPHVQHEANNTVALHLHDRYVLDGVIYTNDDGGHTLNSVPLPTITTGHSHIIISLGDKSLTKTHEIINEFSSKMEWLKLLKQLNVEHKSEGKQTFKGLSRDSRFNMSYIGSKGIIDAHIDMNDTYDANWKQEYLPLLQIGITLWGISFENKQPISDKKLLSLLPEIQKNNPIKKTADINVTIGDKNFTTKISIGYDCAKHGVKAILEIPFKNDVFNDPASKIKTVTDQEMETYIDGSIVATLVFSNSTALLDDVESVLENCKKTLEQPGLFGDLKANRKLAEMLLGAFGQKTDPNKLKIQISYDTINQKINYDTAQNVGDVLSKMLSMVLGSSFGYNEHAHEDHADDVLHGLDTDHVKAAATTQAAIKTRSKKTSTHAVEKATRSTGTRSAGAITRPASH